MFCYRPTRLLLGVVALGFALTLLPAASAAQETCKNADGKQVKAGTRWCRGGDFWVCQKDGKWFNLHASCVGGNRGHDSKPKAAKQMKKK